MNEMSNFTRSLIETKVKRENAYVDQLYDICKRIKQEQKHFINDPSFTFTLKPKMIDALMKAAPPHLFCRLYRASREYREYGRQYMIEKQWEHVRKSRYSPLNMVVKMQLPHLIPYIAKAGVVKFVASNVATFVARGTVEMAHALYSHGFDLSRAVPDLCREKKYEILLAAIGHPLWADNTWYRQEDERQLAQRMRSIGAALAMIPYGPRYDVPLDFNEDDHTTTDPRYELIHRCTVIVVETLSNNALEVWYHALSPRDFNIISQNLKLYQHQHLYLSIRSYALNKKCFLVMTHERFAAMLQADFAPQILAECLTFPLLDITIPQMLTMLKKAHRRDVILRYYAHYAPNPYLRATTVEECFRLYDEGRTIGDEQLLQLMQHNTMACRFMLDKHELPHRILDVAVIMWRRQQSDDLLDIIEWLYEQGHRFAMTNGLDVPLRCFDGEREFASMYD